VSDDDLAVLGKFIDVRVHEMVKGEAS
jgi:hypothetical protein